MSLGELISRLRDAGVRVWVEDGRLQWSAPAEAASRALRHELLVHRAELYALLSGAGESPGHRAPATDSCACAGARPLSCSQRRWVLLSTGQPDVPAAHVSTALRLRGPLDGARLTAAWRAVVSWHAALNTTVDALGDDMVQVVREASPVGDQLVELSPCLSEEALRQAIASEARRPFDLHRGPTLRAALLRRRDHDHVLVLTAHHSFADDWSLGLLASDVMNMYRSGGVAPGTEPAPRRTPADGQGCRPCGTGDAAEHFDVPVDAVRAAAVGSLPAAPPDGAVVFRTTRQTAHVSPALTDALRDVARRQRCTLFIVLLAAFVLALRRRARREEFVIGVPFANRLSAESERQVGLFADTLAVYVDLAGSTELRELLARVRTAFLCTHDRRPCSFAALERGLGCGPSLGQPPLIRVMMAYQNAPWPSLALPGVQVERIDVDTGASAVELCLSIKERDGALDACLDQSAALDEEAAFDTLADWSAGVRDLASLGSDPGRFPGTGVARAGIGTE